MTKLYNQNNKLRLIFLIGLILIAGCSTSEYYFIKNAKIAQFSEDKPTHLDSDCTSHANVLQAGHHIIPGEHLVLIAREFDRGELFDIDDEGYRKLTVEIENYQSGASIDIASGKVRLYFSDGSSGFACRGDGLAADSGVGQILLLSEFDDIILVKLDLKIVADPDGYFPYEKKTFKINERLSFRKIDFHQLTPWLGKPIANVHSQVYPP